MATLRLGSFVWHDRKAATNEKKHGVTFEEAATVLDHPLTRIFEDPMDPQRAVAIGHSARSRLLVVVHIEHDELTRILSAREATKHERRFYEEDT
ncbi:MAG TPA: BrnT family toxin [Polyangiaceae bacterium]